VANVLRRVLTAAGRVLAVGRLALAIPVGYLSVLTVAAWWATWTAGTGPSAARATRSMALLIPARDEARVIGRTLDAMKQLDYPADQFAVHVVADHCTDATVDIARAAGVHVHENDSPARGKGPALTWATKRILTGDHSPDILIIIDADTVVAPDFLRAVNSAFEAGASVVQGQYRVRDPGSSTAAGLRAAALALRHHLRPLGRTALGASCGLYGNGMAFAADVVRGRSWSGHLTEDVEFQMELLLDGILVQYVPTAIVEAEMPETLAGSTSQNERWEGGRVDLARKYVPRLLRNLFGRGLHAPRGPRIAVLDATLDHVVPPLSVLVASTAGVAVASSVVETLRQRRGRPGWGLVIALVSHVLSGLVLAKMPWSVYRALARAPRMIVWKVRLWTRTVARPPGTEWVRTPRVERVGS
jgi:1,2-diacylglycerol 3-beta-glucosyltransferase